METRTSTLDREQTTDERLQELLKGFADAMLVTHRRDGTMHARPLAIAGAPGDGTLYFATAIESGKVREIAEDPEVAVCLQKGGRFVSLGGRARVVTDAALVERLWSESWRLWFPHGRRDPSLCILAVEPREGEYWDRSGVKGLKFAFAAVKAYATGQQPPVPEPEQHGRVTRE